MENLVLGLAVRYSDNFFTDKNVNTVDEHNKILEEFGKVYIGKIGRSIGEPIFKKFNDVKFDRYIILVNKIDKKYIFNIAHLDSVHRRVTDKEYIPSYYRSLSGISTWFCIKEKLVEMSLAEINQWIIRSSKFSLINSISKSMAGFFIVTKGQSINGTCVVKSKNRKKLPAYMNDYDELGDLESFMKKYS